jgi:hypothetical protein
MLESRTEKRRYIDNNKGFPAWETKRVVSSIDTYLNLDKESIRAFRRIIFLRPRTITTKDRYKISQVCSARADASRSQTFSGCEITSSRRGFKPETEKRIIMIFTNIVNELLELEIPLTSIINTTFECLSCLRA